MLTTILNQHYEQFATLAATWLVAGATAVSIWSNGRLLAQWPEDLPEPLGTRATLTAALRSGSSVLGELRVSGLSGAGVQERLATDARLLGQLLRLEDELEDMTAELIETQDQLIALYDLTRSIRSHLDISQTLSSLARTTTRIANVQIGFMVMSNSGHVEVVSHPVALLEDEVLVNLFHQMHSIGEELILDSTNQPDELPSGIYNLCLVPIQVGGGDYCGAGVAQSPAWFYLAGFEAGAGDCRPGGGAD